MILPTIRASFGRTDALQLVELLGRSDPELRRQAEERLERHGVDALLDDPRVLNALLTEESVGSSPDLIFYVLVRQALLEGGIESRETADLVASVVVAFSRSRRAYRVSDDAREEFHYLVDMLARLGEPGERRTFMLKAHLGDYALWLAGLFPDFLEARVRRRGAPPIDYYEKVGAAGYRMASETREAASLGLESTYREVSEHFQGVRVALNRSPTDTSGRAEVTPSAGSCASSPGGPSPADAHEAPAGRGAGRAWPYLRAAPWALPPRRRPYEAERALGPPRRRGSGRGRRVRCTAEPGPRRPPPSRRRPPRS